MKWQEIQWFGLFDPKRLIKEPTCYENPSKPSSVEFFLTNCPKLFESVRSDFDKTRIIVANVKFEKKPHPVFLTCHTSGEFDSIHFEKTLMNRFRNYNQNAGNWLTFGLVWNGGKARKGEQIYDGRNGKLLKPVSTIF